MIETELYGYVHGFSVDYHSIDVNDILDIHKYFMTNRSIKLCFFFIKNLFLALLSTCTKRRFGKP